MRYYLDCEFNGFGGSLISLALVRQDGRGRYYVFAEHAPEEWVEQNVIPILWNYPPGTDGQLLAKPEDRELAARDLAQFLKGDHDPIIISDWPADIRYLCELIEFPRGNCAPIAGLKFEWRRVDAYPTTLEGAVQHNAWWDALALRHVCEPKTSGYRGEHP